MSPSPVVLAFAAVALATAGCADTSTPDVSVDLAVSDANISRCNELIDNGGFGFTLIVDNRGPAPVALGAVTVAVDDDPSSGAPYAAGTSGFDAPVALQPGEQAELYCAPDVPFSWSTSGADALITVDLALSHEDGTSAGAVSASGALQFIDIYDNCGIAAGPPSGCTVISVR